MRALLLLAPLLLATLAGCLDAETAPSPGGDGEPDGQSPFLAYHTSAQDAERTMWGVFAVRPNGTAIRFQYMDDRSAGVRMGEGIEHPVEDVRFLLEPRGGNQNRSAGGVVVMLERGTVAPAAMERLRAALADWPAVPGGGLDDPGTSDVVRFREDGGVDVLRFPPARPEHRELLDAFRLAQEAFDADDIFRSPEAPQTRPPPETTCPRIRMEVRPEAFTPGDTLTATATLENCGEAPLALGQDACGPEPLWNVDVNARGRGRALPIDGTAGAARMHDVVCEGAPKPLVVAPGEIATLVRRWNGTIAECDAAGACAFVDAPDGDVAVVSYLSGHEFPAYASATVVPRGGERTRLLLVKEYDWVNGTAEDTLMGNFGPHCAPVKYTLSPPSVTIRVYAEEKNFSVKDAVLVRDWREGERPRDVVTFSADRLDVAWVDDNVTLASPFDDGMPLARVEADGDDFLVNGTRIPPGGTHVLRSEASLVKRGGAYEVASVLVFRNLGPASVVTERVGGCM